MELSFDGDSSAERGALSLKSFSLGKKIGSGELNRHFLRHIGREPRSLSAKQAMNEG